MDARTTRTNREPDAERQRQRRDQNQTRHSRALTRLMSEREDLRGVHALADFVADSLKWTA